MEWLTGKTWKVEKNMVQALPVTGCIVGPQSPLSVTSVALKGLNLKKEASILLEQFRVIIFLNYFKGL